jgi:hypothetical protein
MPPSVFPHSKIPDIEKMMNGNPRDRSIKRLFFETGRVALAGSVIRFTLPGNHFTLTRHNNTVP